MSLLGRLYYCLYVLPVTIRTMVRMLHRLQRMRKLKVIGQLFL